MATATSKTRRTAGKTAAAKRGATHAQSAPKAAAKRSTAATARAANAKKAAPVKAAATKTRTKVAGRKATPAAPTRKSPERRSHVEKIKIGKSIVARMVKGETMGDVARDLQLYPFQAHQLVGLYHVDKGDVPAITARSEDVLVKKLAAARAKGDEHASWDWLAARSGINKVKIQKMLTEAGYDISDVRTARGARKEAAPARGRKVTSKRSVPTASRERQRHTEPAKAARAARASARTATTNRAARAATKPAQATRPPVKAAPRSESKAAKAARLATKPERNASGRVTAGERTRRRTARIDKVKAEVKAAPAKAAAKAKAATKAAPVTRKRTPVNVPRGARPTAADPS